MFVGHYSASFVAKRVAPDVSLWLLLLAAQAVDVLWSVFVFAGIERLQIVPGITATNALDLQFIPYTHSLVGSLLWSVGLALAAAAVWPALRQRRAVLAIACVIASHWVLDWLTHIPDLPLWGNEHKVGLGLWLYKWPALIVELAMLLASAWWLSKSPALSSSPLTPKRIQLFVAALVVAHLWYVFGRQPTSALEMAASALASYLAFAYWGARIESAPTVTDGAVSSKA